MTLQRRNLGGADASVAGAVSATRPSAPAVPRRGAAGRVMILGGDADHNLGDHAILFALCRTLTEIEPSARITLVSAHAGRAALPGVADVIAPGPRRFADLLRSAARQERILIGGGGLFQDDDSRVKMPYWWARLRLLHRANPHIDAHALGAGPLEHRESRLCARLACDLLQSVSVRDEFARGWLHACGVHGVRLAPDPAFLLPAAADRVAERHLRGLRIERGRPLIGVAVRRWYHRRGGFLPHRLRAAAGLDRGSGTQRMHQLLEQLAGSLRALAARLDADVLLMPTYNVAHEADFRHCQALAQRLPAGRVRIGVFDDPRVYKAVCARLRLMISARMHPLILAAGAGVPIVGLAYNGKFEGLFDQLGLPPRLIALDRFGPACQRERLLAMAEEALADGGDDMRQRASRLAERSRRELLALWQAQGDSREIAA